MKNKTKCFIDGCGMEATGRIKGKDYCSYHYNYYMVTLPLIRQEPKISRNAKCTCGSGKKSKHCCGAPSSQKFNFFSNLEKQAF